jgi:hypothetical protein
MDFGKATDRNSWCPEQPESWKKAADWKKELDAKRRGPSWLGKTAEDFAQMAQARLHARQASWIGHREKTAEDYADEAKKELLREKWIKYMRRMSRKKSFGLGKDRPKALEELAKEQHEKSTNPAKLHENEYTFLCLSSVYNNSKMRSMWTLTDQ